MITQLSYVTVIVRDYDEALDWYEKRLGLEKRMDRKNGDARWLTVGIKGQASPEIILQKPTVAEYDSATQALKLSQEKTRLGSWPSTIAAPLLRNSKVAGWILSNPQKNPLGESRR